MQLGFVGLGKMGLNMVTRLVRGGHQVVAFDRSAEAAPHPLAEPLAHVDDHLKFIHGKRANIGRALA